MIAGVLMFLCAATVISVILTSVAVGWSRAVRLSPYLFAFNAAALGLLQLT